MFATEVSVVPAAMVTEGALLLMAQSRTWWSIPRSPSCLARSPRI
jgi:hypothetical protein